MKIRGLYKAYFFSITFCFIDDLCAINDHLEFNRNFKNVYSSKEMLYLRWNDHH